MASWDPAAQQLLYRGEESCSINLHTECLNAFSVWLCRDAFLSNVHLDFTVHACRHAYCTVSLDGAYVVLGAESHRDACHSILSSRLGCEDERDRRTSCNYCFALLKDFFSLSSRLPSDRFQTLSPRSNLPPSPWAQRDPGWWIVGNVKDR